MSKKQITIKPLKKVEEDNERPLTERGGFRTEKTVEKSTNSDLNFSKDDSYSISNLKQDWQSIKNLQNDIKKTSVKLKQLSTIHIRPLSECGKLPKTEKKSKIDNSQGKTLKKLQTKCQKLSSLTNKYEKEKQDLINSNLHLKDELQKSIDQNLELKKQISYLTSSNPSKKFPEILKYAQFITKKIKDLPKWEEMFLDRILSVSSYISMIKTQKYEDCLLETMQFISDIVVYYSKIESPQLAQFSFAQEDSKKTFVNDESENLLMTINAQSERIAKLNKQISDAMISSKELLFSPIATMQRREPKNTRSSSFTFNPNLMKPIFSTPERWCNRAESIEENDQDEEVLNKP
ncbi:hypothetical protein SteCoe_8437 [Stentor coeruleus]|uniref:Uncharacterized protein n=1 Tax=Stentor coeruleus TaxID=5963 RepID=A0A1R2CKB1_9CILI|nr:hypothetical protein SteCoe_8437 [Stentor coeruleus]